MIRKGVLRGRDILIQCDNHVIKIAAPIAGWVMNNLDIVAGAYAFALAQEVEFPSGLPIHLDIHDPAFIAAAAAHHNKLILNLLNNFATGGGVAVALRHVTAQIAKVLRENSGFVASSPCRPTRLVRVCCSAASATYQADVARSDCRSTIHLQAQHQLPAWQHAVAPQPAVQHVPALQ